MEFTDAFVYFRYTLSASKEVVLVIFSIPNVFQNKKLK